VTSPAAPNGQVSWWSTHEYLAAYLAPADLGAVPAAGTPAWCDLDFDDPRKLLALAIDGEHHVLRVEVAQVAECQASRDVSAAADWTQISQSWRRHNDAISASCHIPRITA
jgi:hypothetical protein